MSTHFVDQVSVSGSHFTRRRALQLVSSAAVAAGTSGFHELMADQAESLRREGRSMILLWMRGGPSQFETLDPKPGTENGGPTEAIETSVPGIRIADNFPQLAKVMDDVAIIRSMTNKEGSHPRATYQMHTGYLPAGSVRHPSLGACVTQQLGNPESELPSFVSIGSTLGAGFLGTDYEPFVVGNPGKLPANVALPTSRNRFARRRKLLQRLETEFSESGAKQLVESHQAIYRKSARLVLSPEVKAFDIADENSGLRDRYGDDSFGRGCLLARRLVERGVTFVEVRSGNWDTHQNNFEQCAGNAGVVDPATATLIADLKDRGMLDRTLVVWMGEFGRTPRINPRNGRDHYPRVFSAAIAGGGIRGGQVYGASTANGTSVERSPVTVHDLFRTICRSMKVDANHENISPLGRPMKVVDGGEVIPGLLS
ncbi:MAG: DUF1501 domain-containing protein [Fuerstiella sp.]|nr:DUF1501 domain-containing protein [Fuerstiella sp.]